MIDLCLALVIDWSASIPPQLGRDVIAAHVAGLRDERVRQHAEANGVAINAAMLSTDLGGDDPIAWARARLVTPGGFVLGAETPAEWLRAILRKMTTEVAGL